MSDLTAEEMEALKLQRENDLVQRWPVFPATDQPIVDEAIGAAVATEKTGRYGMGEKGAIAQAAAGRMNRPELPTARPAESELRDLVIYPPLTSETANREQNRESTNDEILCDTLFP